MSNRPTPPRGMRDVLPEQARRRRRLQATIVETFRSHGFDEIETPVLEDIDRLLDSEGGDNAKLIYKVLKRGLEWGVATNSDSDVVDLGLRYDLTVPLARFFATNQAELPTPFKAIQIGAAFRAERPQKGRFRQFTQCDIDVLGDSSTFAEVELVGATIDALGACGVDDFKVRFNHRKLLDALLRDSGFQPNHFPAALVALDKIDKIGIDAVEAELTSIDTRAGVSFIERVGELSASTSATVAAPYVGEHLAQEMTSIQDAVSATHPATPIVFDVSLVRGQGYYTGPIFEIEHGRLGGSLAGGGRYDDMVAKLSGIEMPATGMSIGFERLDMLLEDSTFDEKRAVLLYSSDDETSNVIGVANEMRATGTSVRTERAVRNQRAQLSRLGAAGITHFATTRETSLKRIHLGDETITPTDPEGSP